MSQSLCSKYNMPPIVLLQLIKQYMFTPGGIHILNFQALNKPKMGTPLCDVTMTLKREEKIGKIFFLKQDAFVYKKCMFDTFTQKCPRDYTVAYTIW